MNICFLSQEYPPETHVGGIGTYTYNMASALVNLGHEVHVITSTETSNKTIQSNGVSVHYIRRRKLKPIELAHFVYSYLVLKTISAINCRFDIVHASEYANEAFWFSLKKSYPLITRLATPFSLAEELNGKILLGARPLLDLMERKQTLNSDGIFSSTYALAEKISAKWNIDPSTVEVIPNSIDLSRVQRLGENNPVPSILKDKEYLIYFGRLEKRKGVSIFARALPDVFNQFPSLYVVFVGSDTVYQGISMIKHIKETVGKYTDRILFFDNQPHERLFPIVNSAKAVILPSLWEAFGFVCLEAMALGRPVIATSGSGFEEIIKNNISGYLVEPGNSTLLSEQIIRSLKDEKGLQRISKEAKKRAQDFDVTKIAHELVFYYKKVRSSWLKDGKMSRKS